MYLRLIDCWFLKLSGNKSGFIYRPNSLFSRIDSFKFVFAVLATDHNNVVLLFCFLLKRFTFNHLQIFSYYNFINVSKRYRNMHTEY